ncbi:MAG: universal stress protein [Kiloniellales bacterium]|nr:universal stress protein [Kiloniellales bacterium]
MVAVDFSPDAEAALIWACKHAETVGAALEVLHVVHDPADSPGTYKPEGDDPLEPMIDVARRRLSRFLDRVARDNPDLAGLGAAKSLCVQGLPAATILEVARSHRSGLLVLGGGHRNGLERLLHGSTSRQVAGQAQLPVTIVKSNG